jgi:hypothetical protein
MRTKTKREIRIEVMENATPMEEALNQLAKVIAAGMIREERETEEKE